MTDFSKNRTKAYFLTFFFFFFMMAFLPTISFGGYGIAIDEEWRNLRTKAIRVLFLNIDTQRAEEVIYYTPKDGHEKYTIKDTEKHPHNPLKYIILNGEAEPTVVVNNTFSLENYTIISKFSLYKMGTQPIDPSLNNLEQGIEPIQPEGTINGGKFKYFVRTLTVQGAQGLHSIFESIERIKNHRDNFAPNFRLIDMTSQVPTTNSGFLHMTLGGNADLYSLHKEDLGEQAMYLSLLGYGYRKIYRTNPRITGFDFVCSSPHNDELFLIDSEWTCETSNSSTRLDAKLNNDIIIKRIEKLKSTTDYPEGQIALSFLRSFLTTTNARVYKLLYKVSDVPSRKKRGIARPCLKALTEEERIEISEKVGFTKRLQLLPDVNSLVAPMGRLTMIATSQEKLETADTLSEFMRFLAQQPDLNLTTELWQFLKIRYPNQYDFFFKKH